MAPDSNINPQPDALDTWLDEALHQYGDVEPRAGLERRILANLESAPRRPVIVHHWGWALGAGTFAAVCIALAFWLANAVHSPRGIVAVTPAPSGAGLELPRNAQSSAAPAHVVKYRARRHVLQPQLEIAKEPRLETFPSLRPLSEQEQLLTRYARDFPGEAAWVAMAQTKRQEELERLVADEGSRTELDQTER